MKKVICFSGLPGVGKSTIASLVAQKTRAVFLDLDEFKKKVVDPNTVSKTIDPPELRWQYYNLAILGAEILPHELIIIDEVFHVKELRNKFEVECEKKNMQVVWVEVTCPSDVIEMRLANPRPGHILSPEEAIQMNLMFSKIFEPFSLVNNYTQISNDGSVSAEILANKIIQKLI